MYVYTGPCTSIHNVYSYIGLYIHIVRIGMDGTNLWYIKGCDELKGSMGSQVVMLNACTIVSISSSNLYANAVRSVSGIIVQYCSVISTVQKL